MGKIKTKPSTTKEVTNKDKIKIKIKNPSPQRTRRNTEENWGKAKTRTNAIATKDTKENKE